MAKQQVHCLPVVDGNDVPHGVLSMDDILLHADQNKWKGCCEPSSEEMIRSLKRMHDQHFPTARGLSLVAIVVAGLTFAFGEGGSKRVLAGVLFGVGMAIAAVNFLSWLFPGS
jgi:type IV secretory pathway VirB2 component (pilin)